MRKPIHAMSVSLDGYIAGPRGEIDWAAPDEELHRFHNDQTRELGAHLLGRRPYEVMLPWETTDESDWRSDVESDSPGPGGTCPRSCSRGRRRESRARPGW